MKFVGTRSLEQYMLFLSLLLLPVVLLAGLSSVVFFLSLSIPAIYFFIQKNHLNLLKKHKKTFLYFVPLLAYVLISSLFSEHINHSLLLSIRVFLLTAIFLCLLAFFLNININCQRLFNTLLTGLSLASLVMLIEIFSEGFFSSLLRFGKDNYEFTPVDLNRGIAFIGLFLWPLLYYFYNNKSYLRLATITILTFAIVFSSEHQTSQLALAASILVFFFVLILKKHATRLVFLPLALAFFAFPFVLKVLDIKNVEHYFYAKSSSSALHRLYIWDFAKDKVFQKPILGWGFDSSRFLPVDQSDYIVLPSTENSEASVQHPMPLHSHNISLQIWLELGFVGIVLFLIPLYFIYTKIIVLEPLQQAVSTSLFAYAFIVSFTGFNIWQQWWLCAIFLAITYLCFSFKESNKSAA